MHAAGLMLTFGYLRRAEDAYTGTEGERKEKKSPVLWLLKTGRAVRMVPLVREGVGDVAHNRNLLV